MEGIELKEELRSAGITLKKELGTAGVAIALAILLCLLIGISVAVYPGWVRAWEFMDKNLQLSKEAPAWIQAIGSVAAIAFAGRFAARQMAHAEEHQRRVKSEDSAELIWASLHIARDAAAAMNDLAKKLANKRKRPPSSSRERIEGVEQTIRVLLASRPHPMAVRELLIILTELAYSRVAIREWSNDEYREYQASTSIIRAKKVKSAADRLSTLYQLHRPLPR